MPTSTWGDPEFYADETYPSALLKYLLKQMAVHFAAQGACIALFDERIGQMRISMHLRLSSANQGTSPLHRVTNDGRIPSRRLSVHLENDIVTPGQESGALPGEDFQELSPQEGALFAVGTSYPLGQSLIGYVWQHNETLILRQEDYLTSFHATGPLPMMWESMPTSYLAVPIQEATLLDEMRGRKRQPAVLGVILLYQTNSGSGFQQKQRAEASHYVERIALYLQNARLQRSQRRASEYLQRLQEISTAFPKSVKLSDLVESMYQFTGQVVDVSAMLLTLYDRDTERIYDVFAYWNGTRVDDLAEQPVIVHKEDRPVWWQVTQYEKKALHFSPAQDLIATNQYHELLAGGVWGDQRHTESFLFLPMKMFNRVIGSLSVASVRPRAYHPEEIQVLETMLQIVTVSIENARLYERDRLLLQDARQRETQLATINSALQSFSSVLNVTELLNKFVSSVAAIVKVDVCAFFQLSSNQSELVAQALHGPTNVRMVDDGSGLPDMAQTPSKEGHNALISMIRLPFKNTFLEQLVDGGFFYLDAPKLEELAQQSQEGGMIFLQEMNTQQMLMIPMTHQSEFIGMLAVSTPAETGFFRPKDIGTLLAISAQAVNAIRNAQLSEQREEAYAELQRMDKLKDEFLVTASHELRTPLSAIIGYASLLKRQSARITPQQCLRFATKIAGAAQQLSDLVANMTEAAKMGAVDKKLAFDLEPVQLLSAAEMATNMLTLSIEQNIILNVDTNLWVRAAAPHLRQVLSNLLENAAKYSPPHGAIQLSATVMPFAQIEELLPANQVDHLIKDDTSMVLIRVQDKGEGILPQDQQRIFEKFVRAPRSLTTPVRGSGLGLYICRRYVEAMEGRLWLEQSIPNEGSIFSFYLPYIDPPSDWLPSPSDSSL